MDNLDKKIVKEEKGLEKMENLYCGLIFHQESLILGFLISLMSASIFLLINAIFLQFKMDFILKIMVILMIFLIACLFLLKINKKNENLIKILSKQILLEEDQLKRLKKLSKNPNFRNIYNVTHK